ncbi:FAD-dependent oxidoreductase [Ponticoccus sp. SC2-23]|uniref:GcvT family protein n=1 Tax=Alexandriicola marinus TaxID=2081710 RepID=UPI000FDA455C|nr:FAD-dependent oxidoreductase [Alexandriicola marinus]MBM1220124.1 FAD-dependent oxidoreductase [Ponticoccus sp. SC6-9]MBM1224810.1 FAD-dependent oxidoreductase [Ponticoccus sp. SC6-15]MBM1228323.1 FAD-dependent oxidoreductase [Ponticoccus sp. SC6-38]MBM1234039.1 FAD-dependent oxidoreductase [Ponticoccus sp. SC6-45]MBM1238825.1 FAD-dependent oxidoreductase [Ponticoccus sp. SC6-49]MBM1242606.1 FAD-dependent oxidoreductase [Ponticoccus sp. SC2-64]MBM1247563.1 FAD-dependent oxidoreductase [Po
MKSQVKALVVGGGAVGTSIAYHLARAGWDDVMLLERDELTSGSTWHAAGLLPYFNMSYATTHIHDYSIKFYKTLEDETGLNAGFYVVGNLRMAQSRARMDEYMVYAATAETVDVPFEWMTPAQIKDRWPLVRTDDLEGAIYHPTDGYINPADVTMAMAKGARQRGVSIERKWQADAYEWQGDHWAVTLTKMVEKGGNLVPSDETMVIRAEHVVTATGNHAQRTARLLGIKTPAIPVEHQFIVTEPDPALVEYRKENGEHPVLRDADAKWYVREERGGWILGPYERNAPARFEYGVPDSFRADLFPLDLDRIEEEYMSMIHRIPSSETVGLKDDYNGPICYTPDGNPLLGPAPGLRNMWLAEGFSFGITAAGGAGKYLADLMVEGEAEIDMASLDPRRFGSWMTTEYAARKNEEAYEHVYILHHPDEERPACRPLRTAPAYDRQKALGAQFGCVNGFERPNYYGPLDADDNFDHDARSFRRGGWWQYAVEEAKAIREGVGLIDASAFTKHRLTGPGATAFLDWFTCNKLPKVGRINLTYALTAHGTTRTEYTIVREAENDYYLVSAGAWTDYDQDFLYKAIADKEEEFGRINEEDVTTRWGVFAIAGPKSRDVLRELIKDADPDSALSNKRFPWLCVRNIELGMCPVKAIRVAYTGELGWELHHPIEMQTYLWDQLMAAGEKHGMKLVGARAQNWLRQEKSYRAFGNELGRDATPLEADLPRFVDLSKEFHGKSAMEETGIRSKCVTLLIDGPEDADPWGREALYDGDTRVGRLTSGGYSVAFGKSIGMGYVRPDLAVPGTRLKVRMLRELWDAEIVEDSPHDPANARIRQDG